MEGPTRFARSREILTHVKCAVVVGKSRYFQHPQEIAKLSLAIRGAVFLLMGDHHPAMLSRATAGVQPLPKDHIEIRCPHCGDRMLTGWLTAHGWRAQVTCAKCGKDFPLAPAVERTVAGIGDRRDLHIVENLRKEEKKSKEKGKKEDGDA
jgi:DNA-directed RNA polymerase subunit RPC12/RpoP